VRSIGKDGSNPQTIATNVHAPQGLFVDATNVFWNEAAMPGRTFKADKDGSNPVLLSTSNVPGVQGLVADADWVYFLDLFGAQGLVKAPRAGIPDGGAPLVVSGGWPYAFEIAQSASNVYWTSRGTIGSADDGGIPGKVLTVPKDGGAASVVAIGSYGVSQLGGPVFVAVDDAWAYWTDEGNYTVDRAPLAGGPPAVLVNETAFPYAITIDGSNLYYTTLDGRIMIMPKDGSAPPRVAVSVQGGFLSQVAFDDKALYFGDTGGGLVLKVAK
jgi:hypothetical protein